MTTIEPHKVTIEVEHPMAAERYNAFMEAITHGVCVMARHHEGDRMYTVRQIQMILSFLEDVDAGYVPKGKVRNLTVA